MLVSEYVNGYHHHHHHHHRKLHNRLQDESEGEKGGLLVAVFFSLDVITRIFIDCDSPSSGNF